MAGIAIECGLMVSEITEMTIPSVAVEILVHAQPVLSPLYEGQSLQDSTGFAAMTDVGNFSSSAGRIVSVVVVFSGAALDQTTVLSEGDIAGFTVTARDDAGNERSFYAGQITVEYKVRTQTTPGNELDVSINPLVPDGEIIPIVVGAGEYAGEYAPKAVDLRNSAYNFSDTVAINGTTGLGDLLTADDGLWSTPTGVMTLTRRWLRDGTPISRATGSDYTITTDDQSADITLEVTGNDGVNMPVVVTSAVLSVPSGTATPVPSAITGLAEWFDASDAASITTDAGVAQLSDKSGNDHHVTQAITAAQPETGNTANNINGLNVITFDGTDDLLERIGGVFDASGTIFIVFEPLMVNVSRASAYSYAGPGAGDFQLEANDSSAFYGRINTTESRNPNNAGTTDLIGSPVIVAYRFNNSTGAWDCFFNGGSAADSNTDYGLYDVASMDFRIGGTRAASTTLNFHFCEYTRHDRAVSNTDLNSLGNYFAAKWGLTWTEVT